MDGNELLRKRPMEWIVDPLRRAGARIVYGGESGRLPVRITGGPLGQIDYQTTVFSAQPVSALLFAGLQGTGPTTIHRRTTARDHTERLLRHLGVEIKEAGRTLSMQPPVRLPAFDLNLPGDISTAALPIACVVASPFKRRLVIEDVGINGTRTGFVRTLERMGAGIEIHETGMEAGEPVGKIVVESGHRLRGIEVSGDALVQSMIDELPLLAALAARAEGQQLSAMPGNSRTRTPTASPPPWRPRRPSASRSSRAMTAFWSSRRNSPAWHYWSSRPTTELSLRPWPWPVRCPNRRP